MNSCSSSFCLHTFCAKSIYISKLLTVLVSFVPLGPNTWQEYEERLRLAHSLRDFQSGTEEGKADVSSVRAEAWDDTQSTGEDQLAE